MIQYICEACQQSTTGLCPAHTSNITYQTITGTSHGVGIGIPGPTHTTLTPNVPQGWECPRCLRIYSPTTPMCFRCPETALTTTGVFTAGTGTGKPPDGITNGPYGAASTK